MNDQETRVVHSQYDPPSAGPVATAASHEPAPSSGQRRLSQTPKTASEFGLKVARILDDIWALYNIDRLTKKTDWSSDRCIEMLWDRELSTFDFDALTQLVVRCHDACIRLSVMPCNMRYLKLMFHPRVGREGRMFDRHPTMDQAVERVRARTYFG